MKRNLFIILLLSISVMAYSEIKNKDKKYNEIYRNQFHFSVEENKMGSPIAIWYNDSVYHLYFQYNPFNLREGYINWGHATSNDLIHWEQKGVADVQSSSVSDSMQLTTWWGSVCSDKGAAVAWYRWNSAVFKSESQNGYQWGKEQLTKGTENLQQCEPYVFWYEPDQKWVMFAYNRSDKTMYIFNSTDGIKWAETSSFGYAYGFPQVVKLMVDQKEDITRWMLITEEGTYILGDFDGKTFTVESSVKFFNRGKNIGGTIVFNDAEENRVLTLSQLKCKQQADLPSNGLLTFPSEISLRKFNTEIEVVQQPAREIEKLHLREQRWKAVKIYPGLNKNLLKKIRGMEFHIKGEITNLNSDSFGFFVRSNKEHQGTEISYNAKQKYLDVAGNQLSYQLKNNKLEFELLIDRSSIEFYIEGGRYVFSTSFSPPPESVHYELFATGGEIMVNRLEVYEMKSIWEEK